MIELIDKELVFFRSSDVRANEQLGLTAMHTLWLREHNRIADMIKTFLGNSYTDDYDETIFQMSRRRVIAEIQKITWSEWLPILIGKEHMEHRLQGSRYRYNSNIDATISNEFGILFRLGHSMINRQLMRLDSNWGISRWGNEALRNAFFQPQKL